MTAVRLAPRLLPAAGDVERLTPRQRRERAELPVALVTMPWAWPRPQLAVGLLTAIGRSHGFPVDCYHMSLDLTPVVPLREQFRIIRQGQDDGLGEWLFGTAASEGPSPDPEAQQLARLTPGERDRLARDGLTTDRLLSLRSTVLPEWLDRMTEEHDWARYRVVGFSSSFAQHAASVALATRIKRRWPDTLVVFGGANMDRPMGDAWLLASPVIDVAVSGEADQVFPTLLAALSQGRDPAGVPGVLTRGPAGTVLDSAPVPPLADLDVLPLPDYRDYYRQVERVGLDRRELQGNGLTFEASRGCWWGERRTCTFCGLNRTTMQYRAKSAARVRSELDELAATYDIRSFTATDNILAREYLTTVLDDLAEAGAPYRLFFEVKANLDRAAVRLLHRSGVHSIQPGIESLNSRVLALMRKGTRASTNVNLLRWATHYGIRVSWNVLWGFPGERPADVAAQAALLPHLVHLHPPQGPGGRIRIERYSPIFNERDTLPIRGLRPAAWYSRTWGRGVDLVNAAYIFEGEIAGALADEAYFDLDRAVVDWVDRHDRLPAPSLTVHFYDGAAEVRDTRYGHEKVLLLDCAAAAAYRACFDGPVKTGDVLAAAAVGSESGDEVLARLEADHLVMRDGGLLVALALPGRRVQPVRRARRAATLAGSPA